MAARREHTGPVTLGVDPTARRGRRFSAALAGWLAGAFAGPVAATAALAASVELACGDVAADCSWGFEYVLVAPVWLACFLGVAPWLVGRAFRRWVDPACERRARRVAGWAAGASILLLFLAASGGGLGAFTRAAGVVVVGVPAAVAGATRHRRT